MRSDFIAVFLGLATVSFGPSVFAPVLAEIRAEFELSFAVLGLALTMPTFARLVVMLPAGVVADRRSPRASLSAGAFTVAMGALVGALAPTFPIFLVGALLQGVGNALISVVGFAHVMRIAGAASRGRAVSRAIAGFQFGSFLGPLAGGLIATALGWRAALGLAAFLAVLAAIAIALLIRSGAPPQDASAPAWRFRLPSLRISRVLLIIMAFSTLVWGAPFLLRQVAFPLYGRLDLGLDPAAVGFVLAGVTGLRMVLTLASGGVVDRFGARTVLVPAGAAGALGALLLVLPGNLVAYIFAGLLWAASVVVSTLPPILVAERAPSHRVGRAMATMQTLTDAALLGGPPAIGALLDASGFAPVGLVLASMYGVGVLVGLRALRVSPAAPAPVPAGPSQAPAVPAIETEQRAPD